MPTTAGAFMLNANYGFYVNFKPQKNPTLPQPSVPFDFNNNDGYDFYLKAGNTESLDKAFAGTNFLFHDQLVHNTYDEYWQKRDLSRHMHGVHAAVMTVGGWFDAEDLSGPFKTFHAIDQFNPGATNTLVVGPLDARRLVHLGWRQARRTPTSHQKTGVYFRAQIQFPFFEHYLKGRAADPAAEGLRFRNRLQCLAQV